MERVKVIVGIFVKMVLAYFFFSGITSENYQIWEHIITYVVAYGIVAFVVNMLILFRGTGIIIIVVAMLFQGLMPNMFLRVLVGGIYFIGALIMDIVNLIKCFTATNE